MVGEILKQRMRLLGMDTETLSQQTFLEPVVIEDLLQDRLVFTELASFDAALLCNALHCSEDFFTNPKAYKNDLLTTAARAGVRKTDTFCRIAGIQDVLRDFAFVTEVEMESCHDDKGNR